MWCHCYMENAFLFTVFLICPFEFVGVGPGRQIAVGTGQFEDIDCG